MQVTVRYIDDHKSRFGVEPICKVMRIAPSTYFEHKHRQRDPSRLPVRAQRDIALRTHIDRVCHENFCAYGVPKPWKQLNREHIFVPRCAVQRLMRQLGLQGVVRGKGFKTTIPDTAAARPADLVSRRYTADRPNQLWVADFTYVATWRGPVFEAFAIDVFSRMIGGWRVSTSMRADFVLDALEQALHARRDADGLIHHSDRGSQYLSIRYGERLAESGIEPSVGGTGDSYDNALAESINGLYKAEVIHCRSPWRNLEDVEFAPLEWVDWFNNRRLRDPIGDILPIEFEQMYYLNLEAPAYAA
jgi:transposase InsO family protein